MRWKKGCSCINLKNGVDAWNRKIRAHASLFGCDSGRRPIRVRKTWCSTTKEQGFAGSGAPRPASRRRLEPGRRGARRRKNKVLRGAEHHVPQTAGALSSEDVVLDDERTRACGRRSTTSGTPAAPWAPKTWCLTTKEQGFAESEAPRPSGNASPRAGGPPKKGPTHSRSS